MRTRWGFRLIGNGQKQKTHTLKEGWVCSENGVRAETSNFSGFRQKRLENHIRENQKRERSLQNSEW